MELWYSLVIGTVIYAYVMLFNRNMRSYLESDKSMPFTIENLLGYTRRESNPSQDIGSVSFYR